MSCSLYSHDTIQVLRQCLTYQTPLRSQPRPVRQRNVATTLAKPTDRDCSAPISLHGKTDQIQSVTPNRQKPRFRRSPRRASYTLDLSPPSSTEDHNNNFRILDRNVLCLSGFDCSDGFESKEKHPTGKIMSLRRARKAHYNRFKCPAIVTSLPLIYSQQRANSYSSSHELAVQGTDTSIARIGNVSTVLAASPAQMLDSAGQRHLPTRDISSTLLAKKQSTRDRSSDYECVDDLFMASSSTYKHAPVICRSKPREMSSVLQDSNIRNVKARHINTSLTRSVSSPVSENPDLRYGIQENITIDAENALFRQHSGFSIQGCNKGSTQYVDSNSTLRAEPYPIAKSKAPPSPIVPLQASLSRTYSPGIITAERESTSPCDCKDHRRRLHLYRRTRHLAGAKIEYLTAVDRESQRRMQDATNWSDYIVSKSTHCESLTSQGQNGTKSEESDDTQSDTSLFNARLLPARDYTANKLGSPILGKADASMLDPGNPALDISNHASFYDSQ